MASLMVSIAFGARQTLEYFNLSIPRAGSLHQCSGGLTFNGVSAPVSASNFNAETALAWQSIDKHTRKYSYMVEALVRILLPLREVVKNRKVLNFWTRASMQVQGLSTQSLSLQASPLRYFMRNVQHVEMRMTHHVPPSDEVSGEIAQHQAPNKSHNISSRDSFGKICTYAQRTLDFGTGMADCHLVSGGQAYQPGRCRPRRGIFMQKAKSSSQCALAEGRLGGTCSLGVPIATNITDRSKQQSLDTDRQIRVLRTDSAHCVLSTSRKVQKEPSSCFQQYYNAITTGCKGLPTTQCRRCTLTTF
eukprot:2674087-Amphidinium_carterae.1